MSLAEAEFWRRDDEKHHELAETYERNVEHVHPPYVTSNGVGTRYVTHDSWGATAVTYYEYRGPNL